MKRCQLSQFCITLGFKTPKSKCLNKKMSYYEVDVLSADQLFFAVDNNNEYLFPLGIPRRHTSKREEEKGKKIKKVEVTKVKLFLRGAPLKKRKKKCHFSHFVPGNKEKKVRQQWRCLKGKKLLFLLNQGAPLIIFFLPHKLTLRKDLFSCSWPELPGGNSKLGGKNPHRPINGQPQILRTF